jgi:competence protein ComEC
MTNEAGFVSRIRGGTALNNESIVTRLECGAESVLFAADIEVEGLRRLDHDGRRPATVLKVPHHGAKSSLDRQWVEDVHPQYAVISVGAANSYGHPVQAVLDAYAKERTTLARTDRDGAVWVTGRVSVPGLAVTRMRDRLIQPVDFHAGVWGGERDNWRRLWLQFQDCL